MSNEKHPYKIVQYRIDIVTRVPAWAEGKINKGDQVVRLDSQSVMLGGARYQLGESYTKFNGFGTPVELF